MHTSNKHKKKRKEKITDSPGTAEHGYALPLQNSLDPDQLADRYLHCLSLNM